VETVQHRSQRIISLCIISLRIISLRIISLRIKGTISHTTRMTKVTIMGMVTATSRLIRLASQTSKLRGTGTFRLHGQPLRLCSFLSR